MTKKFKNKIDKKMRCAGETDYEKKLIRVNPRKRELLNTIIHENLHKKYPDKPETWIKKQSKVVESKLTPGRAVSLLKKFDKPTHKKR